MKASVEWLKEYSDIDVDAIKLGDILTMTGSKVETIDQKGNDIKNVVVGKILEIKKHPDADKLVVTKVDVGTETVQIVTGADNIKENDIVVTSGLGGKEPRGIYVGVVKKMTNDKYNLSKTIYVDPGQDFNNIHYLTVLKEKK